MELVFEYRATKPRFPYLLFQEGAESYCKVLLRDRYLFVSQGTGLIQREQGELDIPFVGANRQPVGDSVYSDPAEASAAFERFRAAPDESISLVRAGHKP